MLQPDATKYAFRHEIVRSNRKSISIFREKKINGVSRLSQKAVSNNDTLFFFSNRIYVLNASHYGFMHVKLKKITNMQYFFPWADPGSENGEKVVYIYIVCTGTLFQCNLFESVYFATK